MTTAQFRAQAGKTQMKIFHITVAALVGTMAVFGVAIATAPSKGEEAAKPAPAAVPVAAAIPVAPVTPPQPAAAPVLPAPQLAPATSGNPLLDGCVISAIGRLPKVDGLRVTKSNTEFRNSHQQWDFHVVSISVDLHGRQANYEWLCRVYANTSADLINK